MSDCVFAGQLCDLHAGHPGLEHLPQLDLLEWQLRELREHPCVRAGRNRLPLGHGLDGRRRLPLGNVAPSGRFGQEDQTNLRLLLLSAGTKVAARSPVLGSRR